MAGTNLYAAQTSTLDICLTDENGLATLAKCTGAPPTTANVFQHGCLMNRTDSGTGNPALYQNVGSSAVPSWTLLAAGGGSATSLVDSNGNSAVLVGTTAAAVNQLTVTNSATGLVTANAVQLTATGTDAAVSLSMAPKGATGILTLGLSTGTGDIVLGSSSGAQTVKIGNGAGVSTVNLANTSVAGANVNIATAATGAGVTDTVAISTGNAAATGIKVVNILTGTPGTSGNNRLTMGGGSTSKVTMNAVVSSYQETNYIASETGANNAIAGALTDASGTNVTLAAGLRVVILLAHTLQAGANTFALNGGLAKDIKSHNNPANNIGTAYAVGGLVDLMYDGTQWQDMSQ